VKQLAHSSVGRYAIASFLVVVATAVALALGAAIGPSGPEIFLAAVMLAAWYGGLGPGLVATGLSVLAIDQFLVPPALRSVLGWDDIVRLLVFVLVSLLISWLNGARKAAKETLQRSHDELELRVRERTADLARTNAVLEEQISERLRAERTLRESENIHRITLSNISDAVFVTDNSGSFKYISPNVSVIFGVTQQDAATVGNIAGLLGGDLFDREELRLLGEIHNIEHWITDVSGTRRLLLVNVKRVTINGGTVLYTCRDITERRQLEEEHNRLEREQVASRAKDEVLAMVSHDLRTPLNSILGWAELIRRRGKEESLLEQGLEAIERGARSQQQLLADLLDIAQLGAASLRLQLHPIDLAALVESAISVVRPDAEARSIEIRSSYDGSVGYVPGDTGRLKQVVLNLLVNGLKFTPSGGVVSVTVEHSQSTARLVVQDNGCGIDAESLPFIFERFYQGDNAVRAGGLGLGLSIARRLVELHGGSIGAHSDGPGRGATFTVDLPMTTVGAASSN